MAHNFHIYINGQAVPVTAEVYKAYYSMKSHERYLERKDKTKGKVLYSDLDTADVLGEEMIPSSKISKPVEQAVIDKFLKERLYSGIANLSDDEQELIRKLYFEGKSQSELSRETGIPRQTIGHYAKQTLEKLRIFIEK